MKKLGILLVAGLMSLAFAACFAQVNQSSAQDALAAGRLDEAAADIQTALAHDPDHVQLKQLAADIFTRRGVQYYQLAAMIALPMTSNARSPISPTTRWHGTTSG